MRILTSPSEIEGAIKHLTGRCDHLRWAVAWASHNFPLFNLLKENESKIRQLTVGIHFYQTHPGFIGAFLDQDTVRFVMNPNGVFHPKLYLFEFEGGTWECVTGSPNFTHGAFSVNAEVAVQISHKDIGAAAAYSKITAALDGFAGLAKRITESDLEAYWAIWKRQQLRLSPLSGAYEPPNEKPKPKKSPLDVPLFVATWQDYFESVKEDTEHTTEGRLAVLEEARRLFTTKMQFNQMSGEERKGIAGFGRTATLDWLWFGSMQGAGFFKQAINQNSQQVSDALEVIPLSGEVSQADFDRYVAILRTAYTNVGVATATRLLAFKRPDYFVCLDSKNRDKLCEAFAVPKNVNLDNYWEKVVERTTDSNWWNSPEPTDDLERRIWKCRAAFLDVRFYEP